MSYHRRRPRALGNASFSATAILPDMAEVREDLARNTVDQLGVSAAYAGPLRDAELAVFDALANSARAGKLPTPDQFKGMAQNLASGAVAAAATVGCAPLGLAAPICGMAAGYATEQLASAIFPGSSGCGHKINGICADQWYKQRNEAVLARCPPGSQKCRDRLQALWKLAADMVAMDQTAEAAWKQRCTGLSATGGMFPWGSAPSEPWAGLSATGGMFPKLGVNSFPADCYKQCDKVSFFQSRESCVSGAQARHELPRWVGNNWTPFPPDSLLTQAESKILLEERYKAEYDYLQATNKAAASLETKYLPGCMSEGCKKQVKGILGEGTFEAAESMRVGDPRNGKKKADQILKNAQLQVEGVLDNASRVADLEKSRISAEQKALEDETFRRRAAVVAAALVCAGAVVYAVTRRP